MGRIVPVIRTWTVLGLLFLAFGHPPSPDSSSSPSCTPGHRALASAVGTRRWIEPRLACGFPYARLAGTRSSSLDREAREELRRAAGAIADELRRGRPGARHAQGALLLLSGDPDRAIAALETALAEAPGSPAVLSDLAAAFLVRASARPQPLDPIAALDHAEEAAGRSPALPEALFNRALARQRLALSDQAARAWAAYLAQDPEPDWAEEARSALATGAAASGVDRWPAERHRLRTAARQGDPGTEAAIVRQHRQETRTFAEEELLAAWADREQGGRQDQARAALDLARAIGRSLEEMSGEAMLADTVAVIDRTREADPERLAVIVAGLRAYAEGLERVTARQFARAEEPLGRAQRLLEEGRCPFAGWAAFLLLRSAYQRSDFAEVQRRAGEMLARWDEARYPVLAGRTRWVLGTTQMALGRPAEALQSYRLALARFQRAGERGHLAAVHTLLASAWQELGDAGAAWRHRHLALRELAAWNDPARLRIALTEAAMAAAEAGYEQAALVLQTEALDLARLAGEPLPVATALLNRAVLRARAGAAEQALQDVGTARAQAARIEDAQVRESVLADLLFVEGRTLAAQRPRRAIDALSEAFALYSRSGRHLLASRTLHERARAYAAAGMPEESEADLWSAIEQLEEERGSLAEAEHRVTFFGRWGSVFDEMVALQVEKGRGAQALDVSERSRARTLLDWIQTLPEVTGADRPTLADTARPQPADELRRRLPPSVVVLCYEVLPDRLLVWIVRREGIRLRESRIAASRLEGWVQRLGNRGDAEAAGRLYGALIRPAAGDLAPGDRLVFVPDDPLSRIPFGALRDAGSGRLLVEVRPFAVAPSLNAFVRLSENGAGARLAGAEVLVLADPAFDRSLFPGLPRLPAAGEEAGAIAAAHAHVRVLRGSGATRAALLDGIGRYGIIHFSGHAIAGAGNPLLSRLALAPGAAGSDSGVLYARELLARRAGKTGLVVLSSCRSAGGSPRGEGVAGLVWPLLSRGIPRVVASLRQVDDRNAARLSAALHRHLAAGEEPIDALRSAQLDCLAAGSGSPDEVLRCTVFQLYGAVSAAATRQGGA